MTGYALYRLPHEQRVTLVAQEEGAPVELASCEALNGIQGFVVAPFSIAEEHPLLLIRPDIVRVFPDGDVSNWQAKHGKSASKAREIGKQSTGKQQANEERSAYSSNFRCFHDRLEAGAFSKIVLSRCSVSMRVNEKSPIDLFQQACRSYPRLFIALVYTERSGQWLTATPEILLDGAGDQWRTMALAGTMKLENDDLKGEGENVTWSTKNIQEQRYVATYLKGCLEHFAADIREEGPFTVRAANLVHLRSDFTFTLLDNVNVGDVLQALHPTPAVCGLPKQETYRFILENENAPRLYYSGFMGPLHMDGCTHLFVSLRCMQITDSMYRMYAGGGLLKNSVEEQEWQETEAKLETMRRVLTD